MAERTANEIIADDWLSPRQAVQILDATFGTSGGMSRNALLECLRGNQIRTVTGQTTFHPENERQRGTPFYAIPSEDWERVEWNDSFWTTGILSYHRRIYGTSRSETVRHFNVRLRKEDVLKIVEPHQVAEPKSAEAPTTPVTPKANKGGRPSKPWWQEFWVEMCCRVFDGDIQPTTTQAAIQEQMHQWVSDRGYEAGETVLKDAAQKLSRALKARSET